VKLHAGFNDDISCDMIFITANYLVLIGHDGNTECSTDVSRGLHVYLRWSDFHPV
jgi:hypothetical protein